MAEPRLLKTEDVAIALIEVGERLRPASPASVDSIAASMVTAQAMIQPVALREKDGRLILMGGLHRMRARERLGFETVRAEIWRCDDQFARLFEVHENLAAAELSTMELAQFLHEAKAAYEALNPQTKAHVANNLARWKGLTDTVSFSSAVAEKRGMTPRHVRRLVQIGRNLDREAARDLRLVGRQPTHRELAAISTLTPEQQCTAASLWAAGEVKDGTAAARAAVADRDTPAVAAPVVVEAEAELRRFQASWLKTSKAGQALIRKWLAEIAPENVAAS